MIKSLLKFLLAGALAFAPFAVPLDVAHAAATSQTTHAYLCQPRAPGVTGPSRIVNPNTSTAYSFNGQGCALIAAADIGYFISQGFTYGPSTFVLQQTAITATTTSATSAITLPAYAYILGVVLSETAGNAITGGVDIGDAGSATRFASAVALGANATVGVADSALTRLYAPSGVPTADQILVACHTSCNSGSINITVLYTFY